MASHVPFLAVRPDAQFDIDVKTRDFATSNDAASSPYPQALATSAMDAIAMSPERRRQITRVPSRIPTWLRFPVVCILSFGISSLLYTLTAGVAGYELATVSRDLTEGWQIGIMIARKTAELGVAWYAKYDCKIEQL